MAPIVSVIVPVYGATTFATTCVLAIRQRTHNIELVIVDDASPEPVDHLYPAADLVVRHTRNRGYGTACNHGAAVASGDILVMLNADTEVADGWLDPLVDTLDQAGIVGPKLRYPDGRIQHAGVRIYREHGLLTAENIGRGEPDHGQHDIPGDVDAVTGACLAVHRDIWTQLGGYHDGYRNGYEDVDLCLAAGAAGYQVRYEPASTVVHTESVSGPERWRYVTRNVEQLQERWGSRWPIRST